MVLREDRAITTRKTKKLIFLVVMSVLVSLSKEHLVTSMKPLFCPPCWLQVVPKQVFEMPRRLDVTSP